MPSTIKYLRNNILLDDPTASILVWIDEYHTSISDLLGTHLKEIQVEVKKAMEAISKRATQLIASDKDFTPRDFNTLM